MASLWGAVLASCQTAAPARPWLLSSPGASWAQCQRHVWVWSSVLDHKMHLFWFLPGWTQQVAIGEMEVILLRSLHIYTRVEPSHRTPWLCTDIMCPLETQKWRTEWISRLSQSKKCELKWFMRHNNYVAFNKSLNSSISLLTWKMKGQD